MEISNTYLLFSFIRQVQNQTTSWGVTFYNTQVTQCTDKANMNIHTVKHCWVSTIHFNAISTVSKMLNWKWVYIMVNY